MNGHLLQVCSIIVCTNITHGFGRHKTRIYQSNFSFPGNFHVGAKLMTGIRSNSVIYNNALGLEYGWQLHHNASVQLVNIPIDSRKLHYIHRCSV